MVPEQWLEQQVRYADAGWGAVAGTVEVADWSGRSEAVQALFAELYGDGTGPHPHPHPHPHGANLGFRASSYLAAGGFPHLPTAEDHALVTALPRPAAGY